MARKYIVWKVTDWDQAWDNFQTDDSGLLVPLEGLLSLALDDAEVIRKQDILSEMGYSAYAHGAGTIRRTLLDANAISDQEAKRLVTIADHFFEAAEDARDWPHKKLPD